MGTPEMNRVGTPISTFEDSPIFSYINNLSPIKPVKSVHLTQTFSSLSFLSPPSVFTSPHVSCHKEVRFLRRHNLLEAPKPKVSSECGNKTGSSEDAIPDSNHAYPNSGELQENTDQGISIGDTLIESLSECTKFTIELQQALEYDCGSPGYDPAPCGDETNSLLELPGELASNVGRVHEACEKDSTKCEAQLQGLRQQPKIEGSGCDWESLIPDGADLLIFNPSNETEAFKGLMQKSLDPSIQLSNLRTQLSQTTIKDGKKMHIVDPVPSGSEDGIEDHPSKPEAATGTDQLQDNLANAAVMASNLNEKMNNEHISITHRCMLRRCLDFEIAGKQRKNSDGGAHTGSSTSQSDERNIPNDKLLLPTTCNVDSQRCILPEIGLHLNALATLKDYKKIKNEDFPCGRRSSLWNSASSLHLSASQQHHQISSVSASSERDLDYQDNGAQLVEDCSQPSAQIVGEGVNQNSPKKKRRKLESAGEGGACKRCKCKKSKCLKLYCECFAAGVYCIEPCSCQDCFNKPIHIDTVLATRKQIESRNPLAFAPKVIRSADSSPEIEDDPNKTPASARHKRGCNCKKSGCVKKYCECYQGGAGCSISCRCEGCKNAYGRKDGFSIFGIEAEPEETEHLETHKAEKALQKTDIQNDEVHLDSALPTTPLRHCRSLLPLPFSSKGKPPRSFITTTSASGLYGSQKLEKPSILRSQPEFVKNFRSIPEDEMPEILQGEGSAITCIKTSPNSKRISSPKCELGTSLGRRSVRKLILQSIPLFPSLNPHH